MGSRSDSSYIERAFIRDGWGCEEDVDRVGDEWDDEGADKDPWSAQLEW